MNVYGIFFKLMQSVISTDGKCIYPSKQVTSVEMSDLNFFSLEINKKYRICYATMTGGHSTCGKKQQQY